MAISSNRWIEDMPTPWDIDCRGKFCIHEFTFDEEHYEYRGIEGKYYVFKKIREQLIESGKHEFLVNNGIDFNKSAKITAIQNAHLYSVTIAVLVDMPHNIRTLYKLTFTETK